MSGRARWRIGWRPQAWRKQIFEGGVTIGDVKLRPHHLLCIQGFRGQGYSARFVANLARLIDRLQTDPDLQVRIVAGADDVCLACPHLSLGDCRCSDLNVDDLDRKISDQLGIAEGDAGTWPSFLNVLKQKVASHQINDFCTGCRWFDFNYCINGIEALNTRQNEGAESP